MLTITENGNSINAGSAKNDIWIDCPTCNGEGSIMAHITGMMIHTLCKTCNGEGGHYFSRRTLRNAKNRDSKLLYSLIQHRGEM